MVAFLLSLTPGSFLDWTSGLCLGIAGMLLNFALIYRRLGRSRF